MMFSWSNLVSVIDRKFLPMQVLPRKVIYVNVRKIQKKFFFQLVYKVRTSREQNLSSLRGDGAHTV